jgi:NAD(P)-dependent dehydrogenase (short-subunit alcohol dehydrogenase family)
MTAHADPLSMFRLDGKVALGGGSGIGRATAAALAGAGAAVAILDIDPERAETTAREIATGGGVATAHQADVTEKSSIEGAVDVAATWHGGLNILVNSAGLGIRRPAVELRLSCQLPPNAGAPRPMKMGTTPSRFPYDAEARDALQSASLRCSAI